MSDSSPDTPPPVPTQRTSAASDARPTGALRELRELLQAEIRERSFDLLAGWAATPPPGRLFLSGFVLGAGSAIVLGLLFPALPPGAGLLLSLGVLGALFQLVRLAERRERRRLVELAPSDARLSATVRAFQGMPRSARTREAIRAALAGRPLDDGQDCATRGGHVLGCVHRKLPE